MSGEVQKSSVDNLRNSDALTVQILVADIIRLHIERIETSVVADLFALADAELPSGLSDDLKVWAGRATREVIDLPEGEARRGFLAEVAALPDALVPERLRAAIAALAPSSNQETLATLDDLATRWALTTPDVLVVAVKKSRVSAAGAKAAAAKEAKPKRVAAVKAPKIPPADIDPRRAAFIRSDVWITLEGKDPGIKENVLVGGIKHRSPFKDMVEPEIRAELRKMERDGLKDKPGKLRIRKSGERWVYR